MIDGRWMFIVLDEPGRHRSASLNAEIGLLIDGATPSRPTSTSSTASPARLPAAARPDRQGARVGAAGRPSQTVHDDEPDASWFVAELGAVAVRARRAGEIRTRLMRCVDPYSVRLFVTARRVDRAPAGADIACAGRRIADLDVLRHAAADPFFAAASLDRCRRMVLARRRSTTSCRRCAKCRRAAMPCALDGAAVRQHVGRDRLPAGRLQAFMAMPRSRCCCGRTTRAIIQACLDDRADVDRHAGLRALVLALRDRPTAGGAAHRPCAREAQGPRPGAGAAADRRARAAPSTRSLRERAGFTGRAPTVSVSFDAVCRMVEGRARHHGDSATADAGNPASCGRSIEAWAARLRMYALRKSPRAVAALVGSLQGNCGSRVSRRSRSASALSGAGALANPACASSPATPLRASHPLHQASRPMPWPTRPARRRLSLSTAGRCAATSRPCRSRRCDPHARPDDGWAAIHHRLQGRRAATPIGTGLDPQPGRRGRGGRQALARGPRAGRSSSDSRACGS